MKQQENNRDVQLELDFARYQIRKASIAHGAEGAVYRCTCGRLSIEDLIDLEHAAELRQAVNLIFPGEQILLSDVAVEHIEPGWIKMEGRVVTKAKS
jgi:hypothetical protein